MKGIKDKERQYFPGSQALTQEHTDNQVLDFTEQWITIRNRFARTLINFVCLYWKCNAGFIGNSSYNNYVRG